jgi:hypothetical protein
MRLHDPVATPILDGRGQQEIGQVPARSLRLTGMGVSC